MIVCGTFTTNFLTFPPDLIIEILSMATAMKDHTFRFRYQAETSCSAIRNSSAFKASAHRVGRFCGLWDFWHVPVASAVY